MQSKAAPVVGRTYAPGRWRTLFGGSIGHFIEWYEWSVYGLLAGLFAGQMFPSTNPTASLIASFAAFAIGAIGRPLGAIILSPLSDKYGRRSLLSATILMSGLGSLVIGLCPAYASIGLAAPIIIVLARVLQGLSAGGEYQIAATFLNEHASSRHRALNASPQHVAIGLAIMFATAVASVLTATMAPAALTSWGWRVPFLIGALFAVYGFYIRRHLSETPAFQKLQSESAASPTTQPHRSIGAIFRAMADYPKEVFIVFVIQMNGVQYYIWLILLPTYAHRFAGLDQSLAFRGNILANIAYCIGVPVFAAISDRIGRKPFLIGSAACFLLFSYPLLSMLVNHGTFGTFVFVAVVGSLFIALNNAVIGSVFAELFPTHVRTSGIGIPYAICAAIFGGTAPLAATYLQNMGGAWYIALYIMAICTITLLTHIFITPETRQRAL